MRGRRIVMTLGVFAAAALAIGPGCKDATQATLEIRMIKSDLCPKLGGTALAVGADRNDVETRISTYVTAETRDCDVGNGTIGSLVVTPGEGGRSAVVVVVAFDTARARTAMDCKPPAYAGCVVARRFFAFSDHKNLRIPISIDPECLDVPCNATSTCRKGNCYDSTSNDGVEPGDDGQGGTTEAGIVDGSVDGFVPDGSTPDGSSNDGGDGGDAGDGAIVFDGGDSGSAPPATCNLDVLYCNHSTKSTPEPCQGSNSFECCDTTKTAQCGPPSSCSGQIRYCCINSDCNFPVEVCKSPMPPVPGRCLPLAAPEATCPDGPASPVRCTSAPCAAGSACCSGPPACQAGNTCAGGKTRWCCNDADCAGEIPATSCSPRSGTAPGTCLKGGVDVK